MATRVRAAGAGAIWAAAMLVAILVAMAPATAGEAPPRRVVSMNVCTDQLAMLLAAPGQLVSVSALARDPRVSAMTAEAAGLPVNHGRAEEIFVLQPDLVLAGSFGAAGGAELLQRLGVRVEAFAPETSLDDVRASLQRMGALLGREAEAGALVAAFDARLAAVPRGRSPAPRAALFAASGYTSGAGTLPDAVVRAAGFSNVAAEAGIAGTARMALEKLVVAAPDLIVTDPRYAPPSLAEALLDHPAIAALTATTAGAAVTDADWVCGSPRTADAVLDLAAHRTGARLAGSAAPTAGGP